MKTIKEWQEEKLSEIAAVGVGKPKRVNWDYYYRTFGVQADVDERVKVPIQIAIERIMRSYPDASSDEIIIDAVNAVVYWVKNEKSKEEGGGRLPMQWSSSGLGSRFDRKLPELGGKKDEEL